MKATQGVDWILFHITKKFLNKVIKYSPLIFQEVVTLIFLLMFSKR